MDEKIESEKRIFKSGYEERLQKAMAQKLQSHKDATERAVQPEISRLIYALRKNAFNCNIFFRYLSI